MPSHSLATVERLITEVRGRRVILAADLAHIYGVAPRALNQAVKRNQRRFPLDFAFRLTADETKSIARLRSQNVILKRGQHPKYRPLAFTEHGAIMAATVLNSARAIQMSVFVVRAFVRLRQWVLEQSELAARLGELEQRVGAHDREIGTIIQAVRRLVMRPISPARRIGFNPPTKPSRNYRRSG